MQECIDKYIIKIHYTQQNRAFYCHYTVENQTRVSANTVKNKYAPEAGLLTVRNDYLKTETFYGTVSGFHPAAMLHNTYGFLKGPLSDATFVISPPFFTPPPPPPHPHAVKSVIASVVCCL